MPRPCIRPRSRSGPTTLAVVDILPFIPPLNDSLGIISHENKIDVCDLSESKACKLISDQPMVESIKIEKLN